MDMFTPATPGAESPDNGHEEVMAAEQHSEQVEQYEQEEEQFEEEQQEELHTEEEEADPNAGHSEKLYAGKYKSPEDMENAYLELQRQFTKQRMAEKQQPTPPPQQQSIQQDEQLDMNDPGSLIDAINRDPMGTIAKIAQMTYQQARTVETQEQAFNRGMDEVVNMYSEQLHSPENQDAYFGKVAEICREMGVNTTKPSPRILKMAAQELWGNTQRQTNAELYQRAKTAAREEIEQSRRTKTGLSAPKGAKVQEVPKTPEELVREGILAASRRGGMFG